MTSITWKDSKTGKKSIKIYRSKDILDKVLKSCQKRKDRDTGKNDLYLITYQGKKIVQEQLLYGISYEEDDEKAIFQKHGVIPKDEDYL